MKAAQLKRVVNRIKRMPIVRRAAEKISSVPLSLEVEVRGLHGTLVVNVPPPPSDVIWYVPYDVPYVHVSIPTCTCTGQIITICCWTDILSVETKFQLCMIQK